jgi:WhiB family redox-sensing transcriptional regulator
MTTSIQYASEWRAAGACQSADPELFFPVSGRGASTAQIAQAKRICAGCQVREQCLDFALRNGERDGIWGGATPEDRTRVRRSEAARRRYAKRPLQPNRLRLAQPRAS